MGKVSLSKLQIVREANLQLSHFFFISLKLTKKKKFCSFSKLFDFWEKLIFLYWYFHFCEIKHTHILKRIINFPQRETGIAKNKNFKSQYLAIALTEPKFQKDLNMTIWTKICLLSLYYSFFKNCYSKKSNWNCTCCLLFHGIGYLLLSESHCLKETFFPNVNMKYLLWGQRHA